MLKIYIQNMKSAVITTGFMLKDMTVNCIVFAVIKLLLYLRIQ